MEKRKGDYTMKEPGIFNFAQENSIELTEDEKVVLYKMYVGQPVGTFVLIPTEKMILFRNLINEYHSKYPKFATGQIE